MTQVSSFPVRSLSGPFKDERQPQKHLNTSINVVGLTRLGIAVINER